MDADAEQECSRSHVEIVGKLRQETSGAEASIASEALEESTPATEAREHKQHNEVESEHEPERNDEGGSETESEHEPEPVIEQVE